MRKAISCLIVAAIASACIAQVASPPASPKESAKVPIKEPAYSSARPLHVNLEFAGNPARHMLVVIDESKGNGKGYDIAYVDENMDGDLTNHAPKKFPLVTRSVAVAPTTTSPATAPSIVQKTVTDPTFKFTGPCTYKDDATSEYTLDLYALQDLNSKTVTGADQYFFWTMTGPDKWNFFFINGKFHTYKTAAEALQGTPIVLGGKCTWSVQARQQGSDVALDVGLKDPNGCTLRTASGPSGAVAPVLNMIDKKGKFIARDKPLEFG
jgi:hypothetical protein